MTSQTLLLVLARQPRWLVGLTGVALLLGVLLLPVVPAALCLALLLGALAWLASLSWPALPPGGRAVRVLALLGLLLVGINALR